MILPKTDNKAKIAALTTSIQQCTRDSQQWIMGRLRQANWKG